MRRTTPLFGAILLASSLAGVSGASAQDDDPAIAEASQRFTLAERHYERGEDALALAEFERVLALMEGAGHPRAALVLYNIGIVNQRMGGREQAALEAYERFLAETPPDTERREEAQRRMLELRSRLELRARDQAGAAPPSTGVGISPVGVVITALGGATLVAGAIFGGIALGDSGSAREGCDGTACPLEARDPIANAQLLANVSDGRSSAAWRRRRSAWSSCSCSSTRRPPL